MKCTFIREDHTLGMILEISVDMKHVNLDMFLCKAKTTAFGKTHTYHSYGQTYINLNAVNK